MSKYSAVHNCAEAIFAAFERYDKAFKEITRRSQYRFEQRDWHGVQCDAKERLDLYERMINEIADETCTILSDKPQDEEIWKQMKNYYANLIEGRIDFEVAETFYNSVTHRILTLNGVNPDTEYMRSRYEAPLPQSGAPIYRTYYPHGTTAQVVENILRDCQFRVDFADLALDAKLAAKKIEARLWKKWHRPTWNRIEVLKSIFYRGKGAYLVGRIWKHDSIVPLTLALLNTENGIIVDAVLMRSNEVSVVFSFARSYFHVDAERPRETFQFLKSILPLKRVAELYITIGHNKHGRREIYHDLLRHLRSPQDKFIIAPGIKGMVMIVFTLPSFPMVFKVIKDRFDYPKSTTRDRVIAKYHLVFQHDRVGRLVDAQEFDDVKLKKIHFSEELLDELQRVASKSVSIEGEDLIIKHLYAERRLTPLDIYIQEAPAELAQEAVNEYGKAIKELAAVNIFPGDVFLKNFGVTRNGRVVFYDYDELMLLTDCNFRKIPQARSFEDEFSAETWFHVAEEDVFPEEFTNFVGLYGPLRDVFFERHEDLCGVDFWRQMQERQRAGEIVDIFPYKQRRRLQRDGAQP